MRNRPSRRNILFALCAGLALMTAGTGTLAAPLPRKVAVTRRLEKWLCTNQDCEPYIYDPSLGAENIEDEDNPIPPGVAFQELPDNWVCPTCGDPKSHFVPYGQWVTVTLEA